MAPNKTNQFMREMAPEMSEVAKELNVQSDFNKKQDSLEYMRSMRELIKILREKKFEGCKNGETQSEIGAGGSLEERGGEKPHPSEGGDVSVEALSGGRGNLRHSDEGGDVSEGAWRGERGERHCSLSPSVTRRSSPTTGERDGRGYLQASTRSSRSDYRHFSSKFQFLEDQVDKIGQRQRKGGLILSSQTVKDLNTGVETRKSLFTFKGEEESKVLPQMLNLIKQKYEVELQITDVFAAHFLPSGSYFLKISNRNPTSSKWGELVKKIKSKPANPDLNFYVNFQLTPKRLALAIEARKLTRAGKFERWATNEKGSVSVLFKGVWICVTSHKSQNGEQIYTFTPQQLADL